MTANTRVVRSGAGGFGLLEPHVGVRGPRRVAGVEVFLGPAPGPARREQLGGELGIAEREPPPGVDELDQRLEALGRGDRPATVELVEERLVALGQGVEVPCPAEDLDIRHERAGLGDEHDRGVDEAELAQHVVGDVLALGVRRDGRPGPDEPEPGERQLAAQLVPPGTLVLRHGGQHDEPAAVPRRTVRAEAVDPLGADGQQVPAGVGEPPLGAPTVPLGVEQALLAQPGRGLAGVALVDAEQAEPVDEGRRPDRAAVGQHQLAEHGQQQGLGAAAGARAQAAVGHGPGVARPARLRRRPPGLVDESDGPTPRPRRTHRAVVDGCRAPMASRSPPTSSAGRVHRCSSPTPPASSARCTARWPTDSETASASSPSTSAATARRPVRPTATSAGTAWPLDLLAVVDHLGGGPIAGFGHSLGGGVSLLAERERPGHVLRRCSCSSRSCSPTTSCSTVPNRMAGPARSRRGSFPSRAEALARYGSRPPLSAMRPDVLAIYVRDGFVDQPDGSVALACSPDDEARTFESEIKVRTSTIVGVAAAVTVAVGHDEEGPNPARLGPAIVAALPARRAAGLPRARPPRPVRGPARRRRPRPRTTSEHELPPDGGASRMGG